MQYQARTVETSGSRRAAAVLPDDRSEWPGHAREAYHDVLRELDRWCRRYDWPATNNAWVAEEAVRRSW